MVGFSFIMIETVLSTVLSSLILISSTTTLTPPPPTPQVVFTRVLPEKNFVVYSVEKNEDLAAVASKNYGSEDYWTTVWNDNAWITDPDVVEKGQLITIRTQKPDAPEELTTELAEKDAALVQKKNEEYLKQIGYLRTEPVQTTIMPTQTKPVNATNVAGTMTEEQITYLGNCEAGMNPAKNTGNGYYGAFQFSYNTWKNLNTGYERADLAPIEVQKAAVQQLLQRSSIFNQFPSCANKMRTAGLI